MFVVQTPEVTHRRVPFREISAGLPYNGGDKKEFNNCLRMSIIGLGVPIYNALHEWLPIMRREKANALKSQKKEKE